MRDIKEGDYVSRDGTDVHYVIELDSDLIKVVCIIQPSDKWTEVGDIETNLTRRYHVVDDHIAAFASETHKNLVPSIVPATFEKDFVDE